MLINNITHNDYFKSFFTKIYIPKATLIALNKAKDIIPSTNSLLVTRVVPITVLANKGTKYKIPWYLSPSIIANIAHNNDSPKQQATVNIIATDVESIKILNNVEIVAANI